MKSSPAACELCRGRASLYCASDLAFLCLDCDAKVHEANFLVARHVRRRLCLACSGFDGSVISGVGFRPVQSLCRTCEAEDADRLSAAASSSSTCISTAESAAAPPGTPTTLGERRRIGRARTVSASSSPAEGVLVNWSRRLGLRNRQCVALALRAHGVCERKFTNLPLRASLAGSLWLAVSRLEPRGVSRCQLIRLQRCSRVPPKLILFVGRRLSRVLPIRAKGSPDETLNG